MAKRLFYVVILVLLISIILTLSSCDQDYPQVTKLIDMTGYRCESLRWSPDGEKLAFWGMDYDFRWFLFVWHKESGILDKIDIKPPDNNVEYGEINDTVGLCWTWDSNFILCTVDTGQYEYSYHLWQVSISDGTAKEIVLPQGHEAFDPDISPDGEWLAYTYGYFYCGYLWKIRIEMVDGIVTTIGNPIKLVDYDEATAPRWSPDGDKLSFNDNTLMKNGNDSRQWLNASELPLCTEPQPPNINIFTVPAEGGEPTQITPEEDRDHCRACWSADGNWLVYTASGTGPSCLWKIPSEGGTPQQLTEPPDQGNDWTYGDWEADCSPDGKSIVFIRELVDDLGIYQINMQ